MGLAFTFIGAVICGLLSGIIITIISVSYQLKRIADALEQMVSK